MTLAEPAPAPAASAQSGVVSAPARRQARQHPPPSVVPSQERHSKARRPENPRPAEAMTAGQVTVILAQCSRRSATGIRNRALLSLLYHSGLRVGEALALRVSDLNHERRSIRLLHTKSGVPQTRGWHPGADDALNRWLDKRRQLGLRGPLFCTLKGRPLWDSYVRTLTARLARQAGLERRVHPHAFRHTFAADLEAKGVPVSTISKLLGHSSIGVTARYLDHLTNEQAVKTLAGVALPAVDA